MIPVKRERERDDAVINAIANLIIQFLVLSREIILGFDTVTLEMK